jgi:hypothetical protein
MSLTLVKSSTAWKYAPNLGRRTAEYLRTQKMPDGEFFIIEECSKPDEAQAIGEHYRSIVLKIRHQMAAQE